MAITDEIKMMQMAGKTDEEIISTLKSRGITPRDISIALGQVTGAPASGAPPQEEMTASLGGSQAPAEMAQMPAEAYAPQQGYPAEYGAGAAPEYGYPQQFPQGGMSTETLTEIAEQVAADKISPLRKDIEKVLDLKTVLESKVDYVDGRLKRIEQIIDKLQMAILQKVGEYSTNIEDLKKEVIETQKSFKALMPSLPSKADRAEKVEKVEKLVKKFE